MRPQGRDKQNWLEAVQPPRSKKPSPASNNVGGQMPCLSDASVELTPRDLVAGCQLGDREAQRELYETHHGKLFRLAVRMVGQQDAADVAQQVFLQVFRKISQFSGRSQLGTWLYQVTVNECLQHLRRNERQQVQHLTDEPVDHAPAHTRRVELAELLEVALQQLDAELRAIFLLREVEELPYREIAEVVGIPEGTVGSRLNRARRLLRQYLLEVEESKKSKCREVLGCYEHLTR